MKKLLLSTGLALVLAGAPNLQAAQSPAPSSTSSWKSFYAASCLAGPGALGTGIYQAGSYAYQRFNAWLEQKIINQAALDLLLGLTRNTTIDTFPTRQREEAFIRKQQLVNVRKSIMKELNAILASAQSRTANGITTVAHKTALETALKSANAAFNLVDTARGDISAQDVGEMVRRSVAPTVFKKYASQAGAVAQALTEQVQRGVVQKTGTNPYAQDPRAQLSLVDTFVKNQMIKSIILKYKPDGECSPQESAKKLAMKARSEKIVQKAEQLYTGAQNENPLRVVNAVLKKAKLKEISLELLALLVPLLSR